MKIADEESRERATILGKFRNLEHDIDGLREQLDEEGEAKADTQRQLSKSSAECLIWRQKYEIDGIRRVEELEGDKLKIVARLEEAEQSVEQLNIKNVGLEKIRQRVTTELEDVQIEVERAQTMFAAAEKRQKSSSALRLLTKKTSNSSTLSDVKIRTWLMKSRISWIKLVKVDDHCTKPRRAGRDSRSRRKSSKLLLKKLKLP